MKVIPVSVGQAFLVGDPEEDDQVLVLKLGTDGPAIAYCVFHNSTDCNHTGALQDPSETT